MKDDLCALVGASLDALRQRHGLRAIHAVAVDAEEAWTVGTADTAEEVATLREGRLGAVLLRASTLPALQTLGQLVDRVLAHLGNAPLGAVVLVSRLRTGGLLVGDPALSLEEAAELLEQAAAEFRRQAHLRTLS